MVSQIQEGSLSDDLNIYTGGQSAEFDYNYTINFDPSQWRAVNFGLTLNASQNFAPFPVSPGTVNLTATANFAGQMVNVPISWNSFDYTQAKSNNALNGSINYGTSGQKFQVRVYYQIPQIAITTAVCNFNVYHLITFQSLTTSPTSYPSATFPTPNITNNGDPKPNYNFQIPFLGNLDPKLVLLGAGVLALVLIARPSAPATIITSLRGKR